jgi:BTB/POZ domain
VVVFRDLCSVRPISNFYIFQVEGCLFKVPRTYFERDSEVFCALFQLPVAQDTPIEGSSDQKPLRLEGIKEDDFRQLLRVMYPRSVDCAL